jgi:hypothetical protein
MPHGLLPHADLADTGERTDKSENAQEPQDNANDYDSIQDRLNGAGHGDESINEPEDNANHDQGSHYVN